MSFHGISISAVQPAEAGLLRVVDWAVSADGVLQRPGDMQFDELIANQRK